MPDCTPEAAGSGAAFGGEVESVDLGPQPASKATARALITAMLAGQSFLIRITCSSLAAALSAAGIRKK
jgi:hypothetical protein